MRSPHFWARRGVRAGLAASTLALVALAGCAGAEPSVAAYVGDAKITDAEVTDAVDAIHTIPGGEEVARQAVLNVMIHGEIASQIATRDNIAITDGQRESVLASGNNAVLLSVPGTKPLAFDVADQQIVSDKIGAEAYLAATQKQSVTLNPRYGALDPAQKLISTQDSGSLTEPGAAATPDVPQ